MRKVMADHNQKIIEHYNSFFKEHRAEILDWDLGPIKRIVPDFQVLRFSPGPKINLWVYCSIGASKIEHNDSGILEFLVISPIEFSRLVETLAMITYYHSNHRLGIGHSVPIGEPWLEGSKCDHWLISLPYPFGEELELLKIYGGHAHVTWLLPITESERNFKIMYGLEALEQKFDEAELKYWEINREPVV